MVKAWIADVTSLYEQKCYERYYEAAPAFRREKADRLKLSAMKAQSIGVWSLWRKIQDRYGLSGEERFNFSHSGTLVMCAVEMSGAQINVGCDVEKVGQLRMAIARNYFCTEEYETILSGETKEQRTELFYRYWVLKESFLKATGKGMALPVNTFSIRLDDPPVLVRQPAEFPEKYSYREYCLPGAPYRMAVCASDTRIDTELHTEFTL